MKLHSFKRGVHPHDGKAYSNSVPIKEIPSPKGAELVFPLSQHIGAPATALVAKGDRVLLGQKIAEAGGFVSSPIFASVSGTVKAIEPRLTIGGAKVNSIVIENDGEFEELETLGKDTDYKSFSKEKILDKVKNAGIVGLGGAGFPTHVKLNPPPDNKIDSIIINAAECEPYLTTDHRLLLEKTSRIITGLEIIMSLHQGAKGYIAIEENKPDAIEAVSKAIEGKSDIEVIVLKCKYPQGSEKHLIYAVTGREVPSGALPAAVGCIVDNVNTVLAIERAVVKDRPLMHCVVTISGDAVANPGNYQVRLGTDIAWLLEQVGGFKEEPAKIIAGGPMMGTALFDTHVPCQKTTSGLLAFTKKTAEIPPATACIRCGKCIDVCPMGLQPTEIVKDLNKKDYAAFIKHNGIDCIECGSCSYTCPAKRHLAQTLRVGKREAIAFSRKK
jgi:electron transport complex protein RnfC